jgi:hypothetical protein
MGWLHIRTFASLCDTMPVQVDDGGNLLDVTVLEPYGVVAGIVPFNWPPIHTASKLSHGVSLTCVFHVRWIVVQLATRVGVSRTRIREAIKIQSTIGRVRVEKGHGLFVADDGAPGLDRGDGLCRGPCVG